MIICVVCGKEFKRYHYLQKYCSKECFKIYRKKYYKHQKEQRQKHRLIVIEHYSNGTMQCNCCGEKHIEFLTIDHIDCGKMIHNKNKKSHNFCGFHLYRWLIKNNYPKGYQVLCFNCNCGKGIFGKCPHEIEKL